MTLPEIWPQGLNAPKIIVRFRKALYSLKHTPRLSHDDINSFLLSVGFTQSLADPNLYYRSDGILLYLYVNYISISYPAVATKVVTEVKANLSEKYKIANLSPARKFLGIELHPDGAGDSRRQKSYIIPICRQSGMDNTHDVSKPIDPNVILDLTYDWGQKQLTDITDYQAVMESVMYAALATRPDISYVVASLSRYNSWPFTSNTTAAEGVVQYLNSTADFRLHYNGNGIGIGMGIGIAIEFGNSFEGYGDFDWANDSADRKSQGSPVFLVGPGAIK